MFGVSFACGGSFLYPDLVRLRLLVAAPRPPKVIDKSNTCDSEIPLWEYVAESASLLAICITAGVWKCWSRGRAAAQVRVRFGRPWLVLDASQLVDGTHFGKRGAL